MKTFLIIVAAVLLFTTVMAQEQSVIKPIARQYDDGHCYEYEVKELTAATYEDSDEKVTLHLHKAEAYLKLDELGQKC